MMSFLRRFRRDHRGASAIEFALILPLLFTLHIGAAEGLQAYVAQRNVAHIAATMADITARNRTISAAELNDVFNASITMMHPLPHATLQQRISSLSANGSGTVTTDWTVNKTYTTGAAPSAPAGYLLANESVIVADVVYDYKPTFGLFLTGTIRMTKHAYVRPRLSTKIEKVA